MASDVQKKQMTIALVGVRPADQITLKGYLRVLLSLDVELHWVAATEPNIDLFMINHEFKNAGSVAKLLSAHPNAIALYIDRLEVGDGHLIQNQLTLPLKQISELHDWLVKHVPALSSNPRAANPSNATSTTQRPAEPKAEPIKKAVSQDLIEMVELYQSHSHSSVELVDETGVIAMIEVKPQRLWLHKEPSTLQGLRMRPFGGHLPDAKDAKDASDWLWQLALRSPEGLMELVDVNRAYQLRYWAKPPLLLRRDALAVMTVLEKSSVSCNQIAQKTQIPLATVQKIVAALMFSGNLTAAAYKQLKSSTAAPAASSTPVVAPPPPSPPSQPIISEAEQEEKQEKMGFLARLRKKLGL